MCTCALPPVQMTLQKKKSVEDMGSLQRSWRPHGSPPRRSKVLFGLGSPMGKEKPPWLGKSRIKYTGSRCAFKMKVSGI